MADNEKQYVSMIDLDKDTEELVGYNPEQDANSVLPPFPAGRYAVMVRFASDDAEKRWVPGIWGKDQQKVLYTNVTATLYNAGEHDGRVVREMVSTYVSRGTCSVQGLLQALGYGEQLKGAPKTRKALVLMLEDALAGDGAAAEVEIEWEAEEKLQDEERAALKDAGKRPYQVHGMSRFDKDADGNPDPIKEIKGQPCKARNVVERWISVGVEGAHSTGAPAAPAAPAQPARPVAAAAPTARVAPPAARPGPRPAPSGPPVPAGARK